MKKIFFIILFISNSAFGQHIFQKTYGNLLDDRFYGLEVINDSDIYITGYTQDYPMSSKIIVSALNSTGNIKWTKGIRAGYDEFAYSIKQLSDGNLFLTGDVADYGLGNIDMLHIKMDLSGNILWKRHWGTTTNETLAKSFETVNNQIISIGYVTYFTSRIWGGLKLVKCDLDGNIIWDRTTLFDDSAFPIDIQQVNENKYFISGSTSPYRLSNADDDMLLAEMDSLGNINWAKGYGGIDEEYPANLALTNDNGLITGTTSFSFDTNGYSDIIVIRTDSAGNVVWSKKFGGNKNERLEGMLRDSSGNYLLWGSSSGFVIGGGAFLVKLNENGDIVWSRIYKGSAIFDLKQIHNQLLMCGQARSPSPPLNSDGFLIQTDWMGNSGCLDTLVSMPYENITVNTYNVSFRDTVENYAESFYYTDTSLIISENTLCDYVLDTEEGFMQNKTSLILAFPNPNEGIFILKMPPELRIVQIKAFNVLGQEITIYTTFMNTSTLEVKIINNGTGLYFIHVTNEDGKIYIAKTLVR